MRSLLLASALLALPACSFLDDFGSFRQPDAAAADGGMDAGTPVDASTDGGGTDAPFDANTCGALAMCGALCVDTTTARTDCGMCGHGCPAGQSCIASMCQPDPIVQLSAGQDHACVLRMSGQLQCWGANDMGQLGDGTTTGRNAPVGVHGLPERVLEVACGSQVTCARGVSGQVYCWGSNFYGEVGTGTPSGTLTGIPTPNAVMGAPGALAIAAGNGVVCAILGPLATPRLVCWGSNFNNQLSPDAVTITSSGRAVDVPLATGARPASLTIGEYDGFTCIATTVGGVQCWGSDSNDEMGTTGTAADRPTVIPGSGMLRDVRAGGESVCGIDLSSQLSCWGGNASGQLGTGSTAGTSPTIMGLTFPSPTGSTTVHSYDVGGNTACAVAVDAVSNELYCWGEGTSGQVGTGMLANFSSPQHVTGIAAPAEVAVGQDFACARTGDGHVYCWGRNGQGQCGTGDSTTNDMHLTPALVAL